VEGVTAAESAVTIEANLADVHERLRRGRYDAPPVKRADMPKEDGGPRPIGMPAFEDKLVQRAVALVLGTIYEQDFYDGSYGFREGRSPQQARHEWRERCMQERIGRIIDTDSSAFLDSLNQDLLARGSGNGSTMVRSCGCSGSGGGLGCWNGRP
jgi:RNA-directed DNA polymerase